jgi:23S rRNA U2552 (ribose-2'-O)-methylase RlmE/FtsJ/virulence-associated protein VapD
MSYFLLHNVNHIIEINDLEICTGKNDIVISKSLCAYLNSMKTQIDNYAANWDIYKKYTNAYEYIHTIIPYTKQSVSKLKPLSRSYYKLIEIHNLLNLDFGTEPINCFHLAEGPGGFIEAMITLRANEEDKYYGMTLIDDNENIPGWKKSKYFLSKHPNVIIEKGKDEIGNLLNVDNLWYCYEKYKNSMDLVTGDGGFDFSIDFNKQETLSLKLIFCQICFALATQKKGGTFIIKIFDVFMQGTIDLLYILSTVYNKVYVIKPYTSRTANSERYIVCRDFKLSDSHEILKKLSSFFSVINSESNIERFINIDLPYIYINKLEDINAILGQQQLENILGTLYLLDNNKLDKIETIRKTNVQKCLQWCIKHKILHNKNIQQLNIFLPN